MSARGEQIMGETVLSVADLRLDFVGAAGSVRALDGVSFDVRKGEIVSLVGESGCGKSVTAMAILGLLPRHAARIVSGSVHFAGHDLVGNSERQLQQIRGNRIGMVFQDPMTSLNPVHTIGFQIAETVRQHRRCSHREAKLRALEMLDRVRIPDATSRLNAYPHELSGGMRQRVMIAMALACDPELLIADEPTTALDVTVQAQILALILDLRAQLGMSVILITHDLGVVSATADRMLVMYAGRIVETGPVEAIFANPSHGYTADLMAALPSAGQARGTLNEIRGTVPRLVASASACTYAPRCQFVTQSCKNVAPPLVAVEAGHSSACIHADAVAAATRDTPLVRAWA
jgi:peptide/nickel transport system ATP-binding protein